MSAVTENQGRPVTPTPEHFVPFGGDESNATEQVWEEKVKESNRFWGSRKRLRYFNGEKWTTTPTDGAKKTKKRSHAGGAAQWGAKIAKTVSSKTATSLLNEICPGLEYRFDDVKGPAHEPCFTVRVLYPPNNKEYIAIGGSKKIAKNNLATKILKDFGVEVKEEPEEKPKAVKPAKPVAPTPVTALPTPPQQIVPTMATPPSNIDFSSDDIIMADVPYPYGETTQTTPPGLYEGFYKDTKLLQRIKNIQNLEDNACLAINCLMNPNPAVYEEISEEGPPHCKTFTYKLTFNSLETYGKGPSKKKAKADAARQALLEIFGPQMFQALLQNSPVEVEEPPVATSVEANPEVTDPATADPLAHEYTLAFSDRIHRLVQQKYELIMKDDPEHAAQKVLAGVVMTVGTPLVDNAQVIVVTTGTKCIEGDSMSELGISVNDCHAEILATRCLRDFLFTQMDRCLAGSDSVFVPTNNMSDGRFELREDIRFHLYISTSPCGDARIFSPKGVDDQLEQASSCDTHPNRQNRGLLRAKIEAGEGTIPVANLPTATQTWDAILQGNALNTMSCSDKLCRYNILGFQGALLSMLVHPIYYSSIVLGSLHHPIHLRRALIGRIEPLASQELPAGFQVARPHRLMVPNEEPRRVRKSPNHAITWCVTWSSHEVLAAAKGRCKMGNIPSRVSKRHAFARFLKLYRNNPAAEAATSNITYADAKLLAKDYQLVKKKFNDLMEESNLGKWISKPLESDSFRID